jgi:hypothetical protein
LLYLFPTVPLPRSGISVPLSQSAAVKRERQFKKSIRGSSANVLFPNHTTSCQTKTSATVPLSVYYSMPLNVPGKFLCEVKTGLSPQSNQSAGPVRFLIFCSISIFLLASPVAGRKPQWTASAD